MFENFVNGDTFSQEDLESDVFRELFNANEIDGYQRSKDPETAYENAWQYWYDNNLFADWLEWRFEQDSYTDYDDNSQDGTFVWMKDYEQCVVKGGDSDIPQGVVAMFDRGSLYETIYAEGIVRDGTFYATVIARELD